MFNDPENMTAITVLEHEIKVCKALQAKGGEEGEYYKEKAEILGWRKSDLEQNVGDGIVSPEKYVADIKKTLIVENAAIKKLEGAGVPSNNMTIARIKKRIALMEEEL